MVRKFFPVFLLLTISSPSSAFAQYDDTPSGAGAWNTCWAMQQGLPFRTAITMSINPMTALIDQRGAQPPQMKRNFMTILNFMETLKGLSETERNQKMQGFIKSTVGKTLQMCPNSIGASEAKELREYINQ